MKLSRLLREQHSISLGHFTFFELLEGVGVVWVAGLIESELIVSSWVGAVIDAVMFYGHIRTCTSAMHFGKGKETRQATIFKSTISISIGSLNDVIIYSPKC